MAPRIELTKTGKDSHELYTQQSYVIHGAKPICELQTSANEN